MSSLKSDVGIEVVLYIDGKKYNTKLIFGNELSEANRIGVDGCVPPIILDGLSLNLSDDIFLVDLIERIGKDCALNYLYQKNKELRESGDAKIKCICGGCVCNRIWS